MKKKKVLLIGWDAADWQVINPLMDAGKMPALKHLVESGVSGNLATLEPVFSPMLWSSIATGKYADKHGVLGFTEPDYDSGGVRPVSTNSRKTAAIWNILSQENLKTNVVGWWPSHPAEKLNGVMVSNFFQKAVKPLEEKWPIAQGSVYPNSMSKTMAELRVHPGQLTENHLLPFVPNAAQIDQEKDKRLNAVAKILSEAANIHNTATYLMENTEWDFMAVYYDNIDHFCHGFMKFHPPKLKGIKKELFETYKEVINAAYMYHDMMLGRMLNLTDENTTIMLISDHGFESGKNRLLALPKEAGAPAYDHRSLGVFAAMGPGIKKDELVYGANLLDITPTLLTMFDLPLGKDMDGKPLINIFEKTPTLKYITSWDEHVERKTTGETDKEAAKEAMDMLVELGYVEKPDDKVEIALEKASIENDFNLARVYLNSNRPNEAVIILEKLFEKEPSVRFGLRLAVAYESLEKYQEGLEILEKLEPTLKNPIPQLLAFKASFLIELKRKKEAFEIIESEFEKRPNTSFVSQRFTEGLMNLGKPKMARQYLGRALKFFPESSALLFLRGKQAANSKRFEKATEHLLAAIGNQFMNPKAHYLLGECLIELDFLEEAHRALTISLQQRPKHKKTLQQLAMLEEKGIMPEIEKVETVQYHAKNKSANNSKVAKKEEFLTSLKGTVYIVSGLPRSGTSMMMQLLNAGGAKVFTDNKRKADKSNPKGYLEHDGIKSLGKNKQLILKAKGKVVKVVAPQLKFLLPRFKYKVIFMERNLEEIIASQHKMAGKDLKDFPLKLHTFYEKQLKDVQKDFLNQMNVETIKIKYAESISNPQETIRLLSEFLPELNLNQKKMEKVVDQKLYRNKV